MNARVVGWKAADVPALGTGCNVPCVPLPVEQSTAGSEVGDADGSSLSEVQLLGQPVHRVV